jgi:hypothetical protein
MLIEAAHFFVSGIRDDFWAHIFMPPMIEHPYVLVCLEGTRNSGSDGTFIFFSSTKRSLRFTKVQGSRMISSSKN